MSQDTPAKLSSERKLIVAMKAVTNTVLSDLVRKWEDEGKRCGETARKADEEWDDTGDQWRERRAVYFDCAEQLKAAIQKINKPTNQKE